MDLEDIKALDAEAQARRAKSFDYYCWDLYARVGEEYPTNAELKAKRAEVLHVIEEGGNATAELADYVATRNVECITRHDGAALDPIRPASARIRDPSPAFLGQGIRADEAARRHSFRRTGKQAGCWVMPFEEHAGTDEHETDKILVRSNGTVTYTGKDIAYQMWKLGILGLDFYYRRFHEYADGKEVWITTADASRQDAGAPAIRRRARRSITSSTRGNRIRRISYERAWRRSRRNAARRRAFILRTRWSPCRLRQPKNLAFRLSDEDRQRRSSR